MEVTWTFVVNLSGMLLALVALGLSQFKILPADQLPSLLMNTVGGGCMATGALVQTIFDNIEMLPFAVLNSCWFFVSLAGLIAACRRKKAATKEKEDVAAVLESAPLAVV